MFDVLCGVLLLVIGAAAGFFLGKTSSRPAAAVLSEEQRKREIERQKRTVDQMEKLLKYSGGAVNDDE